MEEKEYKQNIIETRKGGLGSSDATMVLQVSKSGELNDAAKLRIAVMLGLAEKPEFNKSYAMQLGDDIEMKLFDDYKKMYPNAVSNPLYVSQTLSDTFGFKVLNHIDIEFVVEGKDGGRSTLVWIECKASKLTTPEVLNTYEGQLALHWILLREKANALDMDAQLFVNHYPTNGMINADSYDIANAQLVEIEESACKFNIDMLHTGFGIISAALPNFEYTQPEEIAAYNLPTEVQEALVALKKKMDEVKSAEKDIDDFKAGILEQMEKLYKDRGIKSIKCDAFSITYVAASSSQKFQQSEFKKYDPDTYFKFCKESKSKAYVKIS